MRLLSGAESRLAEGQRHGLAGIAQGEARQGLVGRALTGILGSRLYPAILQVPSLVIFALILYFSLFGTIRPGRNFATVVTWTLWWPLLPVTIFFFARAWCAACPLAAVSSLVQKVAHPSRLPGRLLRRYGIAFMLVTFIGITWADRTWTITRSPRATGVLLLALLAGAIVVSLLYQRRAWCRYMCPIGALTGIYATTAVVEVRAGRTSCGDCQKDCYKGNEQAGGCPLYQYPRAMDSNRNCNLCGDCVKACPEGFMEARLRPPARELWHMDRPFKGEALLAVVMIAVVFMQTFDMTLAWGDYMKWMVERVGLDSYVAVFSLTFFLAMALVLGLYTLGARLFTGADRSWGRNFALFGYVFIPLALAGHIGHNVSHLVTEGPRAVQVAINQVGIPWTFLTQTGAQLAASRPMLPLALTILALGIAGSFYVLWRLGRRENSRRAIAVNGVLLAMATGLFLWLFLLPMNPTHSH